MLIFPDQNLDGNFSPIQYYGFRWDVSPIGSQWLFQTNFEAAVDIYTSALPFYHFGSTLTWYRWLIKV